MSRNRLTRFVDRPWWPAPQCPRGTQRTRAFVFACVAALGAGCESEPECAAVAPDSATTCDPEVCPGRMDDILLRAGEWERGCVEASTLFWVERDGVSVVVVAEEFDADQPASEWGVRAFAERDLSVASGRELRTSSDDAGTASVELAEERLRVSVALPPSYGYLGATPRDGSDPASLWCAYDLGAVFVTVELPYPENVDPPCKR